MKKRNVVLGSVVALLVLLVVGGTMAWFTADSAVINSFKAGTMDIELEEIFNPKAAQNVNPGDTYEKQVWVNITGTKCVYVRAKLTPMFVDEQGEPLGLSTEVVSYEIGGDWIDGEDGYFYYENILRPDDEKTTNIINEVKFDGLKMDNDYQGVKFELKIEADAVQASNYAFRDVWEKAEDALAPVEGVERWSPEAPAE